MTESRIGERLALIATAAGVIGLLIASRFRELGTLLRAIQLILGVGTLLMVFRIQRHQKRHARALERKADQLLAAIRDRDDEARLSDRTHTSSDNTRIM